MGYDFAKDFFEWEKNFADARELGRKNGVPEDDLNSIEHSYFSAWLDYHYGSEIADALGRTLEADSALRRDYLGGKDRRYDTYKDMWNNSIGRQISSYVKKKGLPFSVAKELIIDAYKKGILIGNEYKKDGTLHPKIPPDFQGYPGLFPNRLPKWDQPTAQELNNAKERANKAAQPDPGINSGGRNGDSPASDKHAQILEHNLPRISPPTSFGGGEVSAESASKDALVASEYAFATAAISDNSASQGASNKSSTFGSNLPQTPSRQSSDSSNESKGGGWNGDGSALGDDRDSDSKSPKQDDSSSNSDNGDQGRGGDGGDHSSRGSTSNRGDGYDWGGREGERPGPGGSLDGSSGHSYGGRDEGDKPGPGGVLGGGQTNFNGFDGVPSPTDNDDGFEEGSFGGDPYTSHDPVVSPIVLDLDHDGIELVPLDKSSTYFDYNGDGAVGHTAWIGPGDGLLVFDDDLSGTVNSASEFVFTLWSDIAQRDMWALRLRFDTNKDGVLSAFDANFDKFRVWIDADMDAVTDPGELKTLKQLGLSSIPLTHDGGGKKYSDGSRIYGTATATTAGGKKITVADMAFAIGTRNAGLTISQDKLELLPGDGTRQTIFSGDGDRAKALRLGKAGYDAAFIRQKDGSRLVSQYDAAGKITVLYHLTAHGQTLSSEIWANDQSSLMKFNKKASLTYWHMVGNAGNNTFRGGGEKSDLEGKEGNDILYGGAGNDTLSGGDGADKLHGDAGADILKGGAENDTLRGGAGNDRLSGDGWDDRLYGEAGDDTLSGGEGYDRLYGGAGNDRLDGGTQGDILDGGEGDDTLSGGSEGDELYGGTGNDLLDGGVGSDRLFGDAGNDSLLGGEGSDELSGGEGDDTLNGGAGPDFLLGGAGADWLVGGAGQDDLRGGDGNDRLQGDADDDTAAGGSGDDTLYGGGGADRLRGDEGNDILYGEDGRDDLDGGAGNDLLSGGADNDALLGSGGNDTLYGGTGHDGLVGDAGDDALYGEAGDDVLKGGAGADLLAGAIGADTLYGGVGMDSLSGAEGNDQLYGDAEADSLDGGSGDDKLWGGDGRDTLDGGDGNDVLTGEADDDTLRGGLGDDMLSGGAGNDSLDGGGGRDQLFGGAGNDILIGGPEVDYIDGGEGTDTLVLTGQHADYKIRFNEAIGRFSIVDLRAGSPDGTDLAAIELFQFSDGTFTKAELDYVIGTDRDIAWDVDNSDGSRSTLGWRPWAVNPAQFEIFIQHRTIANILMSETVFHPDGSRLAYAWDTSPDGKGENWASYVQTYDTQARLVKQQYENDDTTRLTEEWDYDGAQVWSHRATWSMNVAGTYEDYHQIDTLHEPDPDPSIVDVIERLKDPANQAPWDVIVREYDVYSPNSNHWLTEDTKYDDGSRILKGKDYALDTKNYGSPPAPYARDEWQEFEERYDMSGRKYYESYTYYGASVTDQTHTVIKEWDYNGQNWADSTLYIEGADRKIWKEINYDTDPTYSKIRWDWHYSPGDWSEQVTYWNRAGQDVKLEQIWRNGDGTVDRGKVIQKDWTAEVKWQRYEYDYKHDASLITQERYLYDDKTYAVIDHDLEGQHPDYDVKTTTYTGEDQTTPLSERIILDGPNEHGATLIVSLWDVANADPEWARFETHYQPDPDKEGQIRTVYQKQYFSMSNDNPYYLRTWNYGTGENWQYSVELYDKNGERYARNYKMDDNTWRTYDYDQNGEKWGRIKQYLLADKKTRWQKETLFDDLHFVIQKWDVGDKNDSWDYYYIRLEHEEDSEEDATWKWYIDDKGVTHYVTGDANGPADKLPDPPPHADPVDEVLSPALSKIAFAAHAPEPYFL